MLCEIYASKKKSETYIYTSYGDKLEKVPEELLKTFGNAEVVMVIEIDANRQLARVKASDVLQSIQEKGYYLQLPPANPILMPGQEQLEQQMAEIDKLNEKLPRGD